MAAAVPAVTLMTVAGLTMSAAACAAILHLIIRTIFLIQAGTDDARRHVATVGAEPSKPVSR